MADIPITNAPLNINAAKLDADLRAAFATFTGLSFGGSDGLRLHFSADPSPADVTQAEGIVAAHDADVLTPEQQATQAEAARLVEAVTRVRDIPQWARISEADALTWLDAELRQPVTAGQTALDAATTLAQVKPIVAGMLDMMALYADTFEKVIRMTLALRDAQWPGLVDEE